MESFTAPDGTRLAYHRAGPSTGAPLVVVPGGPMRDSAYLADLPAPGPWLRLDLRGTGDSALPADPATYACERQADDVEALRVHLDLDRLDLLAHSAGAAVAAHYAARHPQHVRRLVLVNPSPRVAGLPVTDEERRAAAEGHRDEPWFPAASAALARVQQGTATEDDWTAIAPFTYGREFTDPTSQNEEAAIAYYGSSDPAAVRAGLATLGAPVLIVSGEYDLQLPPAAAAAYAGLFPKAELAVLPHGSHFAWYDDAAWLTATLSGFLR